MGSALHVPFSGNKNTICVMIKISVHVYHCGKGTLQIIIVLRICITTEKKLCFNPTNTGPSSFVAVQLSGLS